MCVAQHHSFIGAAIDNWASISCVKLEKWQDSEQRQNESSKQFSRSTHITVYILSMNLTRCKIVTRTLTCAKVAIAKIAKSGHDFARVKVEALVNH